MIKEYKTDITYEESQNEEQNIVDVEILLHDSFIHS